MKIKKTSLPKLWAFNNWWKPNNISQSTECRTFWTNKVKYFKSVQCLSKKKKEKKIFLTLLQSSGVVKHSPLNSHVAWLEPTSSCDLIFNWPRLVKLSCGWALLGIATRVLVGYLDWSPWAGTVGNDWPSVGWGPWSFSGEAAISGACNATGASLGCEL